MSSYGKSVGYRFQEWSLYDEEKLTAAEKARALDTFAAEFGSVPASQEPYSG